MLYELGEGWTIRRLRREVEDTFYYIPFDPNRSPILDKPVDTYEAALNVVFERRSIIKILRNEPPEPWDPEPIPDTYGDW